MSKFTCRLRDIEITIIERSSVGTTWREYSAAPRMYVSVKDESIIDNMLNRKRRPYSVYKTLIRGSLLEQVLRLGDLRWSQYAGCSCSCSPGFVLPKQVLNIGGHTFSNFDVWISIEGAPATAEAGTQLELV